MKKLNLFFVVASVALVFMSCNKKDNPVEGKSVDYIMRTEFVPQTGDVTLKSAPIGQKNELYMFRQSATAGINWELVDGTEFLTGSDPYNFWQDPSNNPGVFNVGQTVYSNYTPIEQLRIVDKVLNSSSVPAYLGIVDVFPNKNKFPLPVKCRRLGDVLTLNTDDLTALPGYNFISFTVSYDKNIIDIDGTIQNSGDTDAGWPAYEYSSTVAVTDQVVSGSGDVTVYDGLEAKITGTITVKIRVDNTTIVKTVPASGLGYGLALKLTTDKTGWYDSANMNITTDDIDVQQVDIPVN